MQPDRGAAVQERCLLPVHNQRICKPSSHTPPQPPSTSVNEAATGSAARFATGRGSMGTPLWALLGSLVALSCTAATNPIPKVAEWGKVGNTCLNAAWAAAQPTPLRREAWPSAFQTVDDPRFSASWSLDDFNARGKTAKLSTTDSVGSAIVVEYDSWESAGITEHVASILLREMVGYEVVLLPRTAHLEGLAATGSVAAQQPTHLQLEMWAAGRQALIDLWTVTKGEVEQVGTVGYSGQSGVYVLNSLVDEQASLIAPQYIDWWRGLKGFVNTPHGPLSVSNLNSTSMVCGTELGGQCSSGPFKCTETTYPRLGCNYTTPGSNISDGMFYTEACLASGDVGSCPLLLFVNPGYDQGYMQSVFNNLGVKAAFAFPGWGATQTWLQTRIDVDEPVMFYWWEPDMFLTKLPLAQVKRVAFPLADKACADKSDFTAFSKADCDFPKQELQKFTNAALRITAPQASIFVEKFLLTAGHMDQLLPLLLDVQRNGTSQQAMFDTACSWLRDHHHDWQGWIPDDDMLLPCPAGEQRPVVVGVTLSPCAPCPQSKTLSASNGQCVCPRGTALSAGGACEMCEQNTFGETENALSCTACAFGSQTARAGGQSRNDCICTLNYFNSKLYLQPDQEEQEEEESDQDKERQGKICRSCVSDLQSVNISRPDSIVCPGLSGQGRLFTAADFWRSSNTSLNIYPCQVKRWCLGANCSDEGKCSEDSCASHRTGILCQRCEPGYGGRSCSRCSSAEGAVVLGLLLLFAVTMGNLSLFLVSKRPRGRVGVSAKQAVDHAQLLAALSLQRNMFSTCLETLFTTTSMVGNIAELGDTACLLELFDFFDSLWLVLLSPIYLTILLWLTVEIKFLCRCSCSSVSTGAVSGQGDVEELPAEAPLFMLKRGRKFLRAASLVFMLVHPTVTAWTLRFFDFQKIDNEWRLRADLRLEYNGIQWASTQPMTVLAVIFNVIALPLGLQALIIFGLKTDKTLKQRFDDEAQKDILFRKGLIEYDEVATARYSPWYKAEAPYIMSYGGALYDTIGHTFAQYNKRSFLTAGWENIRLLRKVAMIAVAVFVHNEDVASNAVLITLVFAMCLAAWAKPFTPSLNRYNVMEVGSLLIVTLTLLLSKLEQAEAANEAAKTHDETGCASTLIFIICANVLFFLLCLCHGINELQSKYIFNTSWEDETAGKNWRRLIGRIFVLDTFSDGYLLTHGGQRRNARSPVSSRHGSMLSLGSSLSGVELTELTANPLQTAKQQTGLAPDLEAGTAMAPDPEPTAGHWKSVRTASLTKLKAAKFGSISKKNISLHV